MMKISVFEYVFHSTWRLQELEEIMRTVSIFKNGNNRAIRLPRDMDFEGVSELEIVREGDSIILRPVRPTWGSFRSEKADPDFMTEREDVVSDEGRVNL
jgi:antitoxin VapB